MARRHRLIGVGLALLVSLSLLGCKSEHPPTWKYVIGPNGEQCVLYDDDGGTYWDGLACDSVKP